MKSFIASPWMFAHMKVNISLSAVANVYALLNDANPGKNFSESNVTLGVPTANAGNGGRNTTIQLTAILDQGYEGTAAANYTRQALVPGGAIATAKDVDVLILLADSDATILTKVAASLGLLESEVSLQNIVKPTTENNPGSADVVADVDSLLYTAAYSVTLVVTDTDMPLSEAVSNADLNGFEPEA